MNISIARELKALRIKRGLNREEVSQSLDISSETLRRYEKDARNITINILSKFFDFYEVETFIFFKNICELTHEYIKEE